MTSNLTRPRRGIKELVVSPGSAGWQHLEFRVIDLCGGDSVRLDTRARETAIVPLEGVGVAQVADTSHRLARRGVFEEPGLLLYTAPGESVELHAQTPWTVAVGAAPARGGYPTRLIVADEVETEIRGGGAARRQVNHLLAPPLPAERLIVFEVYVPAGAWAGWPPHRHDGTEGSPYFEETYFFQFDRPDGFGFHRNYDGTGAYDETFTVTHGDCVSVPQGFHVTTAAPGHNMWVLNFLAGTPVGDERARPPHFDPAATWITDRWETAALTLPHVDRSTPGSVR